MSAILLGIGAISIVLLLLFLCGLKTMIKKIQIRRMKKSVQSFFGTYDLSNFKIRKMGKPGTAYYKEEAVNSYQLGLPEWKKAKEDGTKDETKRFNKIIWKESTLWLQAGRKVYVLTTKDPWEMIYLVHTLRESGLAIAPCPYEVEKQERVEQERKHYGDEIQKWITTLDLEHDQFVELCRERLSKKYVVVDAPKNENGIDLYMHTKGKATAVKCMIVPRNHISGIEEMKDLRKAGDELFVDICMLISTGHITVAAAAYAREHHIRVVVDETLVELMNDHARPASGQEFLEWELTREELRGLIPLDITAKNIK